MNKIMPLLKKAFYAEGVWHIRNAFAGNRSGDYETANNSAEMFRFLYAQGYELVTADRGDFYFKLIPSKAKRINDQESQL